MSRHKHNLSHYRVSSFDMGELIPCNLLEVLPGDTIQMGTSVMLRAAPLLSPVMHPVTVRLHHWFVPHRLIWTDWENFITGGPDGANASVFPTRSLAPAVGELGDYLGLPTGATNTVSMLPFRAYALIWNEWYRDQDLQTPLAISRASGADATTNILLQNCDWEKDYFTSSRPWQQKGPAITIPLVGTAPVVSGGTGYPTLNAPSGVVQLSSQAATSALHLNVSQPSLAAPLTWSDPGLQVNLTGVSAIQVTALRQALSMQRFEEARAKFGSRYVEYLRYLGVRSSDARLQRPEYLGGGRQTIQFSEVLQTAEGTNPVGTLRGHGVSGMRTNRFRRYFEEHGYIMSLISVRPKTVYVNGLPRTWNRRIKEDFWQKELQHIGQQPVLNKEVYGSHSSRDGIFGYQDRYDEYRRQESNVAGEFKTTLNFWHMGRIFAADPALNASFVSAVPTERTFAVPSADVIYAMTRHSIQARRLVSREGNTMTM